MLTLCNIIIIVKVLWNHATSIVAMYRRAMQILYSKDKVRIYVYTNCTPKETPTKANSIPQNQNQTYL